MSYVKNTTKDKGDNSRQGGETPPTKKNTDSKATRDYYQNAIPQTSRQNQREDGNQNKKESSTKLKLKRKHINQQSNV